MNDQTGLPLPEPTAPPPPPLLPPPPPAPLSAVKWRIDSKPHDGRARVVPYLSADLVAELLDGWLGSGGWSDSYELHLEGGWATCTIAVRVGDEWVTRTDIGVAPSGTDDMRVKGLVSDAFKRCGIIKWGVGRNVYALPTLWIPVQVRDRGGRQEALLRADTPKIIAAELRRRGIDLPDDHVTVDDSEPAPDGPETAPADDDDRSAVKRAAAKARETQAKKRVLDHANGDVDAAAEAWEKALEELGEDEHPDLVASAAIAWLASTER